MRSALHDLDGNVGRIFEIFGEPHGGKVAPSQFLDEDVSIGQNFTDVTGMIAVLNYVYPPIL